MNTLNSNLYNSIKSLQSYNTNILQNDNDNSYDTDSSIYTETVKTMSLSDHVSYSSLEITTSDSSDSDDYMTCRKRNIFKVNKKYKEQPFMNLEDPKNNICCLCGFHLKKHKRTHAFIKIKDIYRCLNCNKFFFQHSHSDTSKCKSFQPYQNI